MIRALLNAPDQALQLLLDAEQRGEARWGCHLCSDHRGCLHAWRQEPPKVTFRNDASFLAGLAKRTALRQNVLGPA